MKRLFLLRHAKSSRQAKTGDHARPLAPRGIWAAERVSEYCEKRLRKVDLALCSSAIRARETLRLFEQHLPPSCKTSFDDSLYLAEARVLMAALRVVNDDFDSVLLVGHEPGLSDVATLLCGGSGNPKAIRRVAKGLKPASLTRIDLDIDQWKALRSKKGRIRDVIRPKDLE